MAEQQIVVTNKNSTPTTLLVEGSNLPIAGSGSITIGAVAMMHLLADNVQRLRFLPAGDLSRTAFAPAGPLNTENPAFSVTVDLSQTAITPVVPAAPGRSWVHRGWRLTFSGGAGATVTLQEAGALVEGISINSITSPLTRPQTRWATALGVGLDVSIVGGAAGSATVDCWGAYV
jgi:hypothetical protein